MIQRREVPDYYGALDSMEGLPSLESFQEPKGLLAPVKALVTAWPGLLACAMAGLAAAWISEHHGGPTMLYALLFGMSVNFLSQEGRCIIGIQMASTTVLRFGVALLGVGITFEQIVALGLGPIILIVVAVPIVILAGVLGARVLGMKTPFGLLTGGAVGICGASAALAISSVLPKNPQLERDTILAVIGVTTLSTVAMILYPVMLAMLGFSDQQSGIFIGATVHDVAQVVGAGYSISDEAGSTATFVKLLRVGMLLPVVVVFSVGFRLLSRGGASGDTFKPPLLPLFLVAFAALVLIKNSNLLPDQIFLPLGDFSRWCLVTAIAAIGMKTSFKTLAVVGWRPVILMVAETIFLGGLVLLALLWGM